MALVQTGLTGTEADELHEFIRECERAGADQRLDYKDYALWLLMISVGTAHDAVVYATGVEIRKQEAAL